ncbi:TMV resistance protein N-like [Rutidosis leptorrhynchoides]|uniref:TMV resistance protein N-like n=1 Tax=Rutidosis leptorrhynchoides TaxID=125765 RepID=UPI003A9A26CD
MASPGSRKYDVFLGSFRWEDTCKNYVDHLYKALSDKLISTYKDDQTLPLGNSIVPSLLNAIEESQIAVVVFSEDYADSFWRLDELVHIMKCRDERGLMVIPIFYKVSPSDVRKLKGNFGRAFAKRKGDNSTKEELWKTAIVEACNIQGWEPSHIANGDEAAGIKSIVDIIFEKLCRSNSDVDEDHVGMGTRLQSLKSLLDIGSGGVHMVGIWGVGGSGKTTLAYSAYQKFSHQFQVHCFIGHIREESERHNLIKLQERVLSTLLKKDVNVQTLEGQHKIRSSLSLSQVLIVLDDVDDDTQIDALAGSHEWFGDGSRIVITTRDKRLLHRHMIRKISHASLLSHDEATLLFNRHAVQKDKAPIKDYDTLSQRVVSYADGLPLALKVLGSLLRDKDEKEWMSALEKMKKIPNPTITETLKISYYGLKPNEREIFLDIACFYRGYPVDHAMEILDACEFYPHIGIKVLKEKALITISDGRFKMHKLVQEMGHYIVRGQHPKNPEKHSRVWKDEEIVEMCFFTDSARENNEIEAIRFNGCSSGFSKLVSNMKNLRLLLVHAIEGAHNYSNQDVEGPSFLSNELQYVSYAHYPGSPFPADFHPTKLVVLKLQHTLQKELWKGYKLLPTLKVLHVEHAENLVRTPDFGGLPCLEKLSLIGCCNLEEIHPSLGNCNSLTRLDLSNCQLEDGKIPGEVGELLNLTELNLSGNNFLRLPFSFLQLTQLKLLNISCCAKLFELPEIPSSVTTFVGSE